MNKPNKPIQLGVRAWGIVTVSLALASLVLVIWAGLCIEPVVGGTYKFQVGTPKALVGLFYSVKENGSLIAGILGFSGLAWAHFFKVNNPAPASTSSSASPTHHST